MRAAWRHPTAPHRRRQGNGGHGRRGRTPGGSASPVPGRPGRRPDRLGAGAGGLPRQLLLGAPELARAPVTLTCRLDATSIDIATSNGIVIARHTLATPGAGATIRDSGHVTALERAVLAAHTTAAPHRRKQRIPPGPAARAAAAALRGQPTPSTADTAPGEVVVDLAAYVAAAEGRNTLQ